MNCTLGPLVAGTAWRNRESLTEPPVDDSVLGALEPEGPPGPVGFVDTPTYEAVWAPGEIVPSQVKALRDGDDVELVTYAPEDGLSLMALLVIESARSATEYRFENAVPEGHTAFLHADGSVRFVDVGGNEAGGIAVPWAIDADGNEMPTNYTLDGTTLVQTVEHRGANYPVVADPWWVPIVWVGLQLAPVVVSNAPQVSNAAQTCMKVYCVAVVSAAISIVSNNVPTSGNPNGQGGRPTDTCNPRDRTGC